MYIFWVSPAFVTESSYNKNSLHNNLVPWQSFQYSTNVSSVSSGLTHKMTTYLDWSLVKSSSGSRAMTIGVCWKMILIFHVTAIQDTSKHRQQVKKCFPGPCSLLKCFAPFVVSCTRKKLEKFRTVVKWDIVFHTDKVKTLKLNRNIHRCTCFQATESVI